MKVVPYKQMIMNRGSQRARANNYSFAPIPSCKVEYVYYLYLVYYIFGPALGVEIPLLASAMLLALSVFCIRQLRSQAKLVYRPIALPIACAISFLLIQIGVHGESLGDQTIRAFIPWTLGLITVHSLCLRRGFSLRFPLVMFIIGAT